LTDRGREFLAKGFKDDNIFDVVKFSFGDSEVDYTNELTISNQEIMEPMNNPPDLKFKLYAYGTAPDGIPYVSINPSVLNATVYTDNMQVNASTVWSPVAGIYNEEYSWTNLGPLQNYDFGLTTSPDTKMATIRTYDTTGTTTIRAMGLTSGEYALLILNIGVPGITSGRYAPSTMITT
jgi:hypothetical protein